MYYIYTYLIRYNSMEEIWKDVVGYEGYYRVSNKGRLISVDRVIVINKNKTRSYKSRYISIKNTDGAYGYIHVCLSKNGNKTHLLHRVVAQAFIPNPENKPCVNHLDCNPSNNKIENLEWCTHAENVQYAISINRMKQGVALDNDDIDAIINIYNSGYFYQSEIAKLYKISQSSISNLLNNKTACGRKTRTYVI